MFEFKMRGTVEGTAVKDGRGYMRVANISGALTPDQQQRGERLASVVVLCNPALMAGCGVGTTVEVAGTFQLCHKDKEQRQNNNPMAAMFGMNQQQSKASSKPWENWYFTAATVKITAQPKAVA